jgi:hypothetical protein
VITTTHYYQDFLNYYQKAKILQNECNLGGKPYIGMVDDDLMEQVTIYDTVERRYAGFSNMLQDIWLGSSNPKFFKQPTWMKTRTLTYDKLYHKLTMYEWMYLFFVHRVTGSGASFEEDHGYRNTIIPHLAYMDTVKEMADYIAKYDRPMFTSIGNQIPPFPKPTLDAAAEGLTTGGKYYLTKIAPELIHRTMDFLLLELEITGQKVPIRTIVDYMVDYHRSRGDRAFHFVFTAFAADLADYFPEFVDPKSHMYYGKNAQESMDLMATKAAKMNRMDFHDAVMTKAMADTGGDPRDLEDVFCDYIRYLENYIPDNKQQTYAHLDRSKVWNNSEIWDHPKGRQRELLGA